MGIVTDDSHVVGLRFQESHITNAAKRITNDPRRMTLRQVEGKAKLWRLLLNVRIAIAYHQSKLDGTTLEELPCTEEELTEIVANTTSQKVAMNLKEIMEWLIKT